MPDFKKLAEPFDPKQISWRVGSTNGEKTQGMALAYIDSRDVMDRLDQVCGPDGWQCQYTHAAQKTVCDIAILTDHGWISKADGAGDSDIEAEKGALSDAFKRAAVRWGIGRYLYSLASPWVKIKAQGRSFVIDPSEYPKLEKLLPTGKNSTPEAKKSPPGVTVVNEAVTKVMADIRACDDGDSLMPILNERTVKILAVQVCRDFHDQMWVGPENSGFRGELIKVADAIRCADAHEWIRKVEEKAKEPKK